MPSAFAHAAPALALIPAFAAPDVPNRLWVAGVLCAAAPDLDVAAFSFGIPYGDLLGHRGLSHSIPFAAVATAPIAFLVARRVWLYLFLAMASHGLLDACTNGGLGVALLSPFDRTRWFFPWRPIEVSPLGPGAFLSGRGLAILANELVWVGLPCALVAAALARIGPQIRRFFGLEAGPT